MGLILSPCRALLVTLFALQDRSHFRKGLPRTVTTVLRLPTSSPADRTLHCQRRLLKNHRTRTRTWMSVSNRIVGKMDYVQPQSLEIILC